MLRFRTLYRALKQNTSYQLNHVRGNRYKRDEFGFLHERPDSSRKIKEWKKKHRQEVAAGKKDQVVTKKNLLFVNEKNFLFVKCMIENHRQVGAIYIATVKESKAKFSELYPKEGEKNLNSVRSIGGHAKVQFDVDPADAARIKLISKSQKLDQIFYIDPSQEGDMMKFLKMCAEMLNEGGEIHMILKEKDFQLFKVEEHARAVKIFIKEVTEFFEGYCVGFTLSHVNASEAMIYKLELDTSRKVTTASEALEESNSKESELVDRSLVNTAFGRGLLALSTRDSNESKLASEFVGEFLGRDMSKPLADLERTKLHYHESGRASEVNPSVGQWNMTDLDMINGGTVNYLAIINFLRQNEQAVGHFVTHPQLGEDSSSSIAAVVASMDWPQMTKYKALVSTQPHQQEIMQVLYTPKRGVIHGGLIRELLLNDEGMIRKACISLEMPPVTFALPGFCSRQGTSRSTHNHAENKFTADVLQMLTNSSCYMYARSTCSDSIVQRAYYAHPAAVRGLSYMEGDKSDSDSRGQRATIDRVAEVLSLPLIHDN